MADASWHATTSTAWWRVPSPRRRWHLSLNRTLPLGVTSYGRTAYALTVADTTWRSTPSPSGNPGPRTSVLNQAIVLMRLKRSATHSPEETA